MANILIKISKLKNYFICEDNLILIEYGDHIRASQHACKTLRVTADSRQIQSQQKGP